MLHICCLQIYQRVSLDSHIMYKLKKNCLFKDCKIKGGDKIKNYQGKGKWIKEEWGKK